MIALLKNEGHNLSYEGRYFYTHSEALVGSGVRSCSFERSRVIYAAKVDRPFNQN